MGREARLERVENKGEKTDITSREDSPMKPGFEGVKRVRGEGGSVRFIFFNGRRRNVFNGKNSD